MTSSSFLSFDLKNIFLNPQSIAVIGASEKPGVGKAIFSNIINGYKGKIYPITPSNPTVFGINAFKSVIDISEDIDLAVIDTPNKIVPQVMEEIGKKKIKGVIIVSAGFKEVDESGARLEKQIGDIGKQYGTRIISMGNKVDMDENDILELLSEDDDTKVIVMYLEDIHDGKRFMQIAKRITKEKKKPILVLKSGRTPEGAKAAMSHTGALMGSDETYDALFKQSGVIRVDTMQELFETSTAFAKQPIPPLNGGVVIVSNAGGPAIISTDACSKYGLKMADISKSKSEIAKVIPPHGSARNPVDIVGDADFNRFEKVLFEVISNNNVSAVVTMCTPSATLDYNELAKTIIKTSKDSGKTMLAALMGLAEGIENKKILSDGGIPHFMYAEPAIRTLEAMFRHRRWIEKEDTPPKQFEVDKR